VRDEEGRIRCLYCGKEFDSEQEKGEHVAEEHTEKDRSIPRHKRNRHKKTNIVEEWSRDKGSEEDDDGQ